MMFPHSPASRFLPHTLRRTRAQRWLTGLSVAVVFAGTFAIAACAQTAAAKPTSAPKTSMSSAEPDRAAAYYHYSLAHLYEEMVTSYGRPEYANQAIEEYKLALGADPTSQDLNTGLAELYFRLGRIRDAIMQAQDLVKQNPKNLAAHKLLGRIYLRSLGDMQDDTQSEQVLKLAIAEYIQITELEPKNLEDRLLLGQLYTLDHNASKAKEQFLAARQIDPGSDDAILNLARLYSEQGDTQHALQTLNAVPLEDRTSKIEFALGAAYDQQKDPKQAIAAYRRALDLEPDNLEAERGLAQNLLYDNQLDGALKAYSDISAADPQDAMAYIRIAEIQRRSGQYDQALATLKKAKTLVQDSVEISYNEALIDDSLARFDDAAEILEKLVSGTGQEGHAPTDEQKNNRAIFLERLAIVYREQNKIEQAADCYHKMIALGGEYEVHGYQSLVDNYRDARDWSKATAAAREAVAALPNNRDLKMMLALQLAYDGKLDEAVKLENSMLAGTPADRDVYLSLADIYTRFRHWPEASHAIDQAEKFATKPDEKATVYFARGALLDREKQYDASEAEYRKVLAIDPNNALTMNNLGYSLAERGVRLDDALKLIKKAVELDPQNGAYLDSLGWVYFKMGQYQIAEENMHKALERQPTDPSLHDHLAQLYEKTSRLKLAAAQWDLALHEYQKSNPVDYEPGDMERVEKHLESARVRLAREGPVSSSTSKP
jgi:tetratricopeptide (TPR) repeat protein